MRARLPALERRPRGAAGARLGRVCLELEQRRRVSPPEAAPRGDRTPETLL